MFFDFFNKGTEDFFFFIGKKNSMESNRERLRRQERAFKIILESRRRYTIVHVESIYTILILRIRKKKEMEKKEIESREQDSSREKSTEESTESHSLRSQKN